jgi:hypothetical protein
VTNIVVAQRSAGNPRGEPSVGNRSNDRGKRARSEAAASANDNHRLADNDARRRITQNRNLREYSHDCEHLRNFIDDRRLHRERTSNPLRRSSVRDVTPPGRGSFRALAPSLRQVVWPEKFKDRHIDKYDGSSNFEKFIQVYHMIIEATG